MTDLDTDRIVTGDTFDVLPTLPENSVHAVVTDPPYGLAFMGRDWDDFSPTEYQAWCERWAGAVKRVLKPGGHLLAFSGNRTHHRLFTGVEDAGFEIRDTLTWHYGSGFPKASDISKTIDKRADAERKVVATREADDVTSGNYGQGDSIDDDKQGERTTYEYTKPATDAAKKWDGWKTGLKPATEYVVMARKPFDGATVDAVLEHGTGALNIDACRVGGDVDTSRENSGEIGDGNKYSEAPNPDMTAGSETGGRYPANVVFDETAAAALDREVGETTNHDGNSYDDQTVAATGDTYGEYDGDRTVHSFDDSGGPSRYFYTSKASRSERTEGGAIDNDHPTVKPLDLAEWLIRLVTREGQVVLDPFAGSGTIPKAAKGLGRQFLGIERQPRYADIARVRCGLTPEDPANVRSDDSQTGIDAYTDGGNP